MEGGDVAILYMDTYQGYATDYNITAKSSVSWFVASFFENLALKFTLNIDLQCVSVLGANRGVCRDDQLGGTDSNQFYLGSRVDGLTVITYRRSLISRKYYLSCCVCSFKS